MKKLAPDYLVFCGAVVAMFACMAFGGGCSSTKLDAETTNNLLAAAQTSQADIAELSAKAKLDAASAHAYALHAAALTELARQLATSAAK